MQINGVELEYNYSEEKTNRATMEVVLYMAEKGNESVGKPLPDSIGILSAGIKHCFDLIFGEGTGERVCGKENDLLVCVNAYNELIEEKQRQEEIMLESARKLQELLGETEEENEKAEEV